MKPRAWMQRVTLACALAMAGCAAQSFQPTFKTPSRPEPAQIAEQLASAEPRRESSVLVALGTDGTLAAWDLAALTNGPLWQHAVSASSAPLVAGDAVVLQEGDSVVVRALASGEVRATLGDGMRLLGADGEGDAVVIALTHVGEAQKDKGAIAYVSGSSVRWQHELSLAVGTPALVRGYVVVPWATQRLSVLDVRDGAELARWHWNAAVLGHARVEGEGVYVGQHGLFRLRPDLLELSAADARVIAPLPRQLPGQPPLLQDGYAPAPEPDNASHRVRLDFRIGAGDTIAGDAVYARFYRLVFGLSAREDRVRFVQVLPRDVAGAQVVRDGLLLVDEGGALRFVQHDGRAHVIAELGRELRVAALRAPGWVLPPPASAPTPTAAATGAQAAPASAPALPTLDAQLHAAATLDDSRLAAGRVYAVEHLARSTTGEVTRQLVAMCIDAVSPESVRRKACDSLEGRNSGGDAVLAALRNAQGKQARTSALAKAAASMQLRPAAALLLPQLLDPRTDPAELAVLIRALAELGHQPAAVGIDRFLRLHHAEPEGSDLQPALRAAAAALATLRSKPHRSTLVMISGDALTPPALRTAAQEALAALDAPPKRAPEPAPAQPQAAPEPAPPPVDDRPRYLSAELVEAALKPVQRKLEKCMQHAPDAPKSARIAMVIGPTGEVESAFVTPGTLQICIEALVLPRRFPETQQGRQNVTHTVWLPEGKSSGKRGSKSKPAKSGAKPGKPAKPEQPGKPASAQAAPSAAAQPQAKPRAPAQPPKP